MVHSPTTRAIPLHLNYSDISPTTAEAFELFSLQHFIGVYGLDSDILKSIAHFLYDCKELKDQIESIKSTNKLLIERKQHYYLRIAYDINQIDSEEKNNSAQIELINIYDLDKDQLGKAKYLTETQFLPSDYRPGNDSEFNFSSVNDPWIIPDDHLSRFCSKDSRLSQTTTQITPTAFLLPTSSPQPIQQNTSKSPKPKKRTIRDRDNTPLEQVTTKMSPLTRTEANRTCPNKSTGAINAGLKQKQRGVVLKSRLPSPQPRRIVTRSSVDTLSTSTSTSTSITQPSLAHKPLIVPKLQTAVIPSHPLPLSPSVAIQTTKNQPRAKRTVIAQLLSVEQLEILKSSRKITHIKELKTNQPFLPIAATHTALLPNSLPLKDQDQPQPASAKPVNHFVSFVNDDENFTFYSENQKLLVRAALKTLYAASVRAYGQANADRITLLGYLDIIQQTTNTDIVTKSLLKMIIRTLSLLGNTSFQNASQRPSFKRFKPNE